MDRDKDRAWTSDGSMFYFLMFRFFFFGGLVLTPGLPWRVKLALHVGLACPLAIAVCHGVNGGIGVPAPGRSWGWSITDRWWTLSSAAPIFVPWGSDGPGDIGKLREAPVRHSGKAWLKCCKNGMRWRRVAGNGLDIFPSWFGWFGGPPK